MTPGQSIVATYYQLPGNGEMMHALGMFQEGGDSIRVAHDRLFLIGIMCDDIDTTMAEISGRGLAFLHDEPRRYAVGESNSLGTLNGVEIFVARHIPGGDKIGREMMFTKDGSSDFGDETQGGLFRGVMGLDFAVADLDAALATFRAVLGVDSADTTARTAAPGVRSGHFPAPGGGRGLREVGFFALDGSGEKSPLADRISGFLAKHGDGIFRMNLLVTDIAAMRALLASRGIVLPQDEPVLADICGTDLRYVVDSQ
ncbi:VOC family protein [Flavisphingomonas formosensis]|uniref:hypothetical protein n=1 Tax=Flavisphingomonas formosensis TaxID=861534 RepID=UPI0012F829EB|nr:hypothetical protein [Sphingomonas formosensis]